ncbi:SprT family zinc-dependent metalloprotease [Gemella morbillorum]|uniref:M48 family metallopeptidase n=1 Tax=Gemella morbillorum TaxID=29391 RepID=UPI00319DACDD
MNKKLVVEGLDITIKYRKGMKNIYLRVEKTGDIIVKAPLRTPNYVVKKLIYENLSELKRRQNNILNSLPKKREYKTGETYFIFGKELPIEVVNSNKNTLIITEEKLILVVKNENQDREKIFQKGIREKLRQQSLYFIKKYELIMNVKANELRIKKMNTRWGTCNLEAKRIWINQELIKYPISCLEHIVVHELTHLLEINHTPRFYELLEHYYPNYKHNDKLIKDFNRYLNGR